MRRDDAPAVSRGAASSDEPRTLRVGIDENGLGPRLGPLVVTAIAARTWGNGHAIATSKPKGAHAARIGDSKALVSFGDSVLGEAWARTLVSARDLPAANPDSVVHSLSIDAASSLQVPCPTDHRAQCWSTAGEGFAADPALLRTLQGDLGRLQGRGVEVLGAHVVILCSKRLNEATSQGISRFRADLFAMERLLLHVREAYGAELEATCGKVGGYNSYPAAFGPLSGRLHTTVLEGRARSEYRIANLGRVAFVRDADEGNLLVALASLVGKWVRDLLTRRVTAYHRAHDPDLPEASGYHDPVTTRFIQASALARRARGIDDTCFERSALPPAVRTNDPSGSTPLERRARLST